MEVFEGVGGFRKVSGAPGGPQRPPEAPQRLPEVPKDFRFFVDLSSIVRPSILDGIGAAAFVAHAIDTKAGKMFRVGFVGVFISEAQSAFQAEITALDMAVGFVCTVAGSARKVRT